MIINANKCQFQSRLEVGLIRISLPFCKRPVLHGEISGEQPHALNLKARLRQMHEPHPPLKLRVKPRKTPDAHINDPNYAIGPETHKTGFTRPSITLILANRGAEV